MTWRRGSLPGLALVAALASGCGEGLPEVPLTLAKNCNEAQLVRLLDVGLGSGERILDVAADGVTEARAWVLVRRELPGDDDALVVQLRGAAGVEHEQVLPIPAVVSPGLSLRPDPATRRVWVVRAEPGLWSVYRVATDDPGRELLSSDNLAAFPSEQVLCDPCDTSTWRRDLVFLSSGPAVVSVPPFSIDAGLIIWAANLDITSTQVRVGGGNRLNFEPPCDDDISPEGQAACEMDRMTLTYPEITVLGVQQDPRRPQAAIFGHRVRRRIYDNEDIPLDSADVFMASVFIDSQGGGTAGVLRSYSGIYSGAFDLPPEDYELLPGTQPPFGIASDRFATYGLFSNGGVLPRIVQLPNDDPDFIELTDRAFALEVDSQLLQMDRDLAFGRIDENGRWVVHKFFPDDPSRSRDLVYEPRTPITAVRGGGIGTFLLEKEEGPAEVVRLRCPEASVP